MDMQVTAKQIVLERELQLDAGQQLVLSLDTSTEPRCTITRKWLPFKSILYGYVCELEEDTIIRCGAKD
jgi:hypothetical protein